MGSINYVCANRCRPLYFLSLSSASSGFRCDTPCDVWCMMRGVWWCWASYQFFPVSHICVLTFIHHTSHVTHNYLRIRSSCSTITSCAHFRSAEWTPRDSTPGWCWCCARTQSLTTSLPHPRISACRNSVIVFLVWSADLSCHSRIVLPWRSSHSFQEFVSKWEYCVNDLYSTNLYTNNGDSLQIKRIGIWPSCLNSYKCFMYVCHYCGHSPPVHLSACASDCSELLKSRHDDFKPATRLLAREVIFGDRWAAPLMYIGGANTHACLAIELCGVTCWGVRCVISHCTLKL